MNRRLFVLVALVVLLTSMASADGPHTFDVVQTSPGQNGIVTSPQVKFTWTSVAISTFIVTVKSASGDQQIKLQMNGSACVTATTCELLFDPVAHGWTWRDGSTYAWRIVWKDGSTILAKTPFSTFVVDMLRPTQNLALLPNGYQLDTGFGVVFYWSKSYELNDYRVVVIRPDGSRFTSGWLNDLSCFPDQCVYTMPFTGEATATNYRWYVQARRDGVKGTIKSAQTMFEWDPA